MYNIGRYEHSCVCCIIDIKFIKLSFGITSQGLTTQEYTFERIWLFVFNCNWKVQHFIVTRQSICYQINLNFGYVSIVLGDYIVYSI